MAHTYVARTMKFRAKTHVIRRSRHNANGTHNNKTRENDDLNKALQQKFTFQKTEQNITGENPDLLFTTHAV